jgi:DNA-binding transcriptional LysR family regulator
MVRIVCASPDYLAQHGVPRTPGELLEHHGLDWDGLAPPYAWRFELDGKLQLCRPKRLRMTANNAEALLFSALAGLGIAHLPTWLISDYLLRGELLPLFCENGLPAPEPSGIYALRLERETDSRSRLLLEFLKNRFGPVAPWDLALQSGLQRS